MNMQVKLLKSLLILASIVFSLNLSAQDCKFGIFKLADHPVPANQSVQTFPTAYPEAMGLNEITVVLPSATDLSDIKKTKIQNTNILLEFSYKGARKWANFTKEQIGKQVAIVVNNKVYSMPVVNAQIKEGLAMITGLKDLNEAKELNEFLSKSKDL